MKDELRADLLEKKLLNFDTFFAFIEISDRYDENLRVPKSHSENWWELVVGSNLSRGVPVDPNFFFSFDTGGQE